MSFDLQAFIAAPTQELLNLAKKSDLLDIAAHYELTSVNKSMLKQEIKNMLVQFLVEILDSSALSLVLVTQTGLQMRELEIQRQIEFEKLRLEQEKLKMQMEERLKEQERQMQIEREKLKFDAELRMKELEMQNKTVKPQPLDFGIHFDVTKHIRLVPPFQEKRS